MPTDPTQVAQDKDFLAAAPDDQIKYLSSVDSDFAKAQRPDQLAYIQHITGQQPKAQTPPVAPNNNQSFSDAFGYAKSHGPSDQDVVNAYDTSHPFLGKLARFATSAGDAAMDLPSSLYHAFTDPSTPEELKEFPHQIPGETTLSRLAMVNPAADAAIAYGKGQVSPKAAASVAPDALGGATGTVAAAAFLPKLADLARVGVGAAIPKPVENSLVDKAYSNPGDHVAAALRSDTHVDVPAEANNAHAAIEEGLADRGVKTPDFKGRNGPAALKAGIDNAIDINEARAKQVIDPIRGEAVDPQVLSDNPELAERFKGKAKVTYGDLDAERIKMNKELRTAGFYSKPPSAQYAAQDPLASTEAAVGQARDLVYSKAEQTTGMDLRPLKQTESSLIKLGDIADKTKNTLSAKGAVHATEPLSSKIAQSAKQLVALKARPVSSFFSYEAPGVGDPLGDFNRHMKSAFPDIQPAQVMKNGKLLNPVVLPKYNLNLTNPSGSSYPPALQQLLQLSGGEHVPGENLTLTPSGDMPPALQRVLPFENPGVRSQLYPGAKK